LDWNHDGTLLAIGSYDAILRVVDWNGKLYFSHPPTFGEIVYATLHLLGSLLTSPVVRRDQYLELDFLFLGSGF
jgi:hypothetical protein